MINIQDVINSLNTYDELINYDKDNIKLQNYLYHVNELVKLNDGKICLEGLKTFILLIKTEPRLAKFTSLTLSGSGKLHIEWQQDKNNCILLRPKNNNFIEYVIFKPSYLENKRIIINGYGDLFDVVDLIYDLESTYLFLEN